MKLTTAQIFDLDHRINQGVAEVSQTLTCQIDLAHDALQAERPEPAHMGRVGQAMARNAAFGIKLSFECATLGFGLPLPRVIAPLRRMHLPTGLGRRFGLMGVVEVGKLAVGTYGRRADAAVTGRAKRAGLIMPRDHFETGLTGYLVRKLLAHAPSSQHLAGKVLAAGCRMGALMVCIASTAVRTGLHVIGIIMGASLSMLVAPALGAAAGLYQAIVNPETIVDFKTWADAHVAQHLPM